MRLRRLDLSAFGPFSGQTLDLSGGGPGGLHVIYGENEAGKSTALRAVTGLLYGIPERTQDAHLHPMVALRVGACLEASEDFTLEVVRKKGRSDTLRDAHDAPIDEAVLAGLLGGIGEEQYRTLFGLDHERLKQGGEALLSGAGDIGESLFDAGTGGRGVHALLEELRERAEKLFRPRASTAKLNMAVKAYKEAKQRVREASLAPEVWLRQTGEIESARAELEQIRTRLRQLKTERNRIERVLRLLPGLARRKDRLERRAALGSVIALPADARARRERAQQAQSEAAWNLSRIEREIAQRREQRAALVVDEPLVALDAELIKRVEDDIAILRKAAKDRLRLEAEIRAGEAQVESLLRRLGHEGLPGTLERLRVLPLEQKRIRALCQRRGRLDDRVETVRRRLREDELELAELSALRASLPAPVDPVSLERALASARRQGELESRLEQAREVRASRAAEVARRRRALGPDAGAEGATNPPPLEAIEAFERRDQELGQLRARREEEQLGAEARLREIEGRLRVLSSEGELPSEAELVELRACRELGWQLVRRAWLEHEAVDEREFDAERKLPEAFEHLVERADVLADRLRHDARRVSELASLSSDRELTLAVIEKLALQLRELHARADQNHAEWRALWRPSGIVPRSALEMVAWRRRFDELVTSEAALCEAERQLGLLERQAEALRNELCSALAVHDVEPGDRPSLSGLVQSAERRLGELAETARRRAELEQNSARVSARLESTRRELDELEGELCGWRSEFGAAVSVLGLSPEASSEEAIDALEETVGLFSKLDEVRDKQRRVEKIERDRLRFSAEVERLIADYASDLPSSADSARELVTRARETQRRAAERNRLDGELSGLEREKESAAEALERALLELAELVRVAGARDAGELPEIEERVRVSHELERELREIEDELLGSGMGLSLEQLLGETEVTDHASSAARLEEIEREVEETERVHDDKLADLKSKEAGLDRLGGEQAAEAAQDQALLAAEVSEHVSRFVRLRLATLLLAREIERYRERHQGPVLARASQLFPRLTLGRYAGLRTGLGEQVLYCVRSDGVEVEVAGLSEGAQYQLYLSLRLATLERYLETNPALPLVFDDVLIHFDDARARAALEVLGELAARIQILFFTHLERDLVLSSEAVPASRRFEHRLGLPVLVPVASSAARRARRAER